MGILLISKEVWESLDGDRNYLFSATARDQALGDKNIAFIEDQPEMKCVFCNTPQTHLPFCMKCLVKHDPEFWKGYGKEKEAKH